MNTIKQLIDKYCPDGVEYKKLGEIADIGTGSQDRKDAVDNGMYPFYVRSKDVLRIDKYLFDEEAIIIPGEGGIGDIFHYVKGKYGLHQRAYRVHLSDTSILTKYLYYYFSSSFKKFIFNKAVSATVTSIRKPMLEKFEVPVPPIPVQREIVRILDSFTSLEAELEAELEARRKQYEYYRDQLLSFKHLSGGGRDEVEWKTLGEVGTFKRGKYFQKSDMQDEGIPCIHYGQIYTYYNTYTDKTIKFVSKEVASKSTLIRPQSIIITLTSENIEDVCKPVAWIGNEDVAISGHSVGLETDMDPKYITYYLESSHFFKEKRKKARGAKVIEIKPEELAKIAIPIPPLSTQRRIVSILDRFESLVNDITTGLPAEITARHQQYEYYRDQLLSFKRKS